MKRLMTAVALSCVLSTSTLAGDIPSVGVTSTTPGGTESSPGQVPSVPGDVPTVGYTGQLSDAALNLIQIMLGAGI